MENRVYYKDKTFEDNQRYTYIHEIGEVLGVPHNLSSGDKKPYIEKANNKLKVKPFGLLKIPKRSDFSDIEISFIVSAFDNVPLSVLAHTFNTTKKTILELYDKYKHNNIEVTPLLMVYDTSRYLNDDTIRQIYDYNDLNNPDDPLTQKELLRIKSEDEKDYKIYKEFFDKEVSKGNTIKYDSFNGTSISVSNDYIKGVKSFYTDEQLKEFTKYNKIFSYYNEMKIPSSSLVSYKLPFKVKFIKGMPLYIKYNPIYINFNLYTFNNKITELLTKAYSKLDLDDYYNDINMLSTIIDLQYNIRLQSLGNIFSNHINKTYSFKNSFNAKYHLVYTTDTTKWLNYKPNKDNTFYVTYHTTRPPIYNKADGSPLLDTKGNFRYRMYRNTYKQYKDRFLDYKIDSNKKVDKDVINKYKLTYLFGISCKKCNTFLSKHTVTKCECGEVKTKINYILKKTTRSFPENKKPKESKIKGFIKLPLKYLRGIDKLVTETLKLNSMYVREKLYTYNYKGLYKENTNILYTYKPVIQVYIDTLKYKNPKDILELHYYKHNKNYEKLDTFSLGIMEISTYPLIDLYLEYGFVVPNTLDEPYII